VRHAGAPLLAAALERAAGFVAARPACPVAAEGAVLLVRSLNEEIAGPEAVLGAGRKRELLGALTAATPEIVALLRGVAERGFGAWEAAGGEEGDDASARAWDAAVAAAVDALARLGEWCPLAPVGRLGIPAALGVLGTRGSVAVREAVADCLGVLGGRRNTAGAGGAEDRAAFADVQAAVGAALLLCGAEALGPAALSNWEGLDPDAAAARAAGGGDASTSEPGVPGDGPLDPGGDLEDYGRRLCEAAQVFGSTHLACLPLSSSDRGGRDGSPAAGPAGGPGPPPTDPAASPRLAFLTQMVAWARHGSWALSSWALPFWAALFRDERVRAQGPDRRRELCPDAVVAAVVRLVVDRVGALVAAHAREAPALPAADRGEEARGGGGAAAAAPAPPPAVPFYARAGFDTDAEWHQFFSAYKGQLLLVLRSAAALGDAAEGVLGVAADGFERALGRCDSAEARGREDWLQAEEQLLEAAVSSVPARCLAPDAAGGRRCAALLGAVLAAPDPPAPAACVSLAGGVLACARYLERCPDLMGPCMDRVLRLVLSVPGGGPAPPPAEASLRWRLCFVARSRIVSKVLGLGAAAPRAALPHLEALGARTQALWDEGRLTHGERNILAETMLSICERGGADPGVEARVMEWILGPLRASWDDPAFVASLDSTPAFLERYCPVAPGAAAGPAGGPSFGGGDARWRLFNELQLVERCLRHVTSDRDHDPDSVDLGRSVFDAWVGWLFGRLVPLLRRVQWVSGADGRAHLGPARAACLDPSLAERLVLLGQQPSLVPNFMSRSLAGSADPGGSVAGGSVDSLRTWLRGVREGVYQVVSASAERVPALFGHAEVADAMPEAVVASYAALDPRFKRITLRHVVLPLMRRCPRPLRGRWLGPLLGPLMAQMEGVLSSLWEELATSAQGTGGPGVGGASRALPSLEGGAAPATPSRAAPGVASSLPPDAAVVGPEADEVVRERIVRDVTKDYAAVLQARPRRGGT